jgi:purine-nucleoside phosphorylase
MAKSAKQPVVSELQQKIQAAVNVIRTFSKRRPEVGIILGTGLGALAAHVKKSVKVPYADIPGFPRPTVPSHAGELVIGELGGKPVATLSGRFHYYEEYYGGRTMQEITFPVRVLRALGAQALVVSGASGGMNPQYRRGDIVMIEDHINLMGDNPLIGPNDDTLGPRYPDMSAPYDRQLMDLAVATGLSIGVRCHTGVYVAVAGPNLETRAEYRFLRAIGGDVVGMSVVPEVLVAVHSSMRVLGMAIVTDMCLPDALKPMNIDEIIRTANTAERKMTAIVKKVVAQM